VSVFCLFGGVWGRWGVSSPGVGPWGGGGGGGGGGVLFRKLELDMDLERIWRWNIWRPLWALSPKIDGRNVLRDRHDEEKRGGTSASK